LLCVVAALLRDLGAISSVSAIVHPLAFPLIDTILQKEEWTSAEVHQAQELIPCLMKGIDRPWSDSFKQVVAEIKSFVQDMFCAAPSSPLAPETDLDDSCATFTSDGSWAPGKGVLRSVPFYTGAVCQFRSLHYN